MNRVGGSIHRVGRFKLRRSRTCENATMSGRWYACANEDGTHRSVAFAPWNRGVRHTRNAEQRKTPTITQYDQNVAFSGGRSNGYPVAISACGARQRCHVEFKGKSSPSRQAVFELVSNKAQAGASEVSTPQRRRQPPPPPVSRLRSGLHGGHEPPDGPRVNPHVIVQEQHEPRRRRRLRRAMLLAVDLLAGPLGGAGHGQPDAACGLRGGGSPKTGRGGGVL